MDVPGKADALGLGWVYMAPKNGQPVGVAAVCGSTAVELLSVFNGTLCAPSFAELFNSIED
jgi:hypothetical protein